MMAVKDNKTPKTDAEKQKQQLIVLAVLMIGAGCYLGYTMYLQPKLDEFTTHQDKLLKARQDVSRVEMSLRNSTKVNDSFKAEFRKLEFLNRRAFPPRKNVLMWIGTVVEEVSTKLGVPADKRSYRHVGVASIISKKDSSFLEDYMFEVEVEGDVHLIGRFIAEFERMIPFATVTKVDVNMSGDVLRGVFRCVVPRFTVKGLELFEAMSLAKNKTEGGK